MKPNIWVSSSQAKELLTKQLVTWPLARNNYQALESVRTKSFDLGGFTIRVQFNPARAVSSGAKVDAKSLSERKCFLCPENLPIEQERLPFGFHYLVLCNPFPIFPEHFTIPTRKHTDQLILLRIDDFLELAQRLNHFTIFYNGPKSGASAPDHAHFQAATRSLMPIDEEIAAKGRLRHVLTDRQGELYLLTHYLRNGFVIKSSDQANAASLFRKVYAALPVSEGETEPMMNLFGSYRNGHWILTIIPRKKHRPWQYAAEGKEQILSSPGAADIGGLFITPREEDFEKITPELLADIYGQVCLSDQEVEEIISPQQLSTFIP